MSPCLKFDLRDAHVVIVKMRDYWFAQGLDIDYSAQGGSLQEVKERFQTGLLETVREHLNRFGTLQHFLAPPPAEVREGLTDEQHHKFSVYAEFKLDEDLIPPFSNLVFMTKDDNHNHAQ